MLNSFKFALTCALYPPSPRVARRRSESEQGGSAGSGTAAPMADQEGSRSRGARVSRQGRHGGTGGSGGTTVGEARNAARSRVAPRVQGSGGNPGGLAGSGGLATSAVDDCRHSDTTTTACNAKPSHTTGISTRPERHDHPPRAASNYPFALVLPRAVLHPVLGANVCAPGFTRRNPMVSLRKEHSGDRSLHHFPYRVSLLLPPRTGRQGALRGYCSTRRSARTQNCVMNFQASGRSNSSIPRVPRLPAGGR